MSNREQGLSLRDIGLLTETVAVNDEKSVEVRGIAAADLIKLINRFPDMQKWMSGEVVNIRDILVNAPDAIAAIIAIGCGDGGDPEAEGVASMLPFEVQMDIIQVVGRLTFRSGFGPFVQRMLRLVDEAASGGSGKVKTTSLPNASNS